MLAAGGLLALGLLVQTAVNYQYVSTNLIRQEARRVAEDKVRAVERAARQSGAQEPEPFLTILDEVRNEAPDQVAALTLRHADGNVVAAAGRASADLARSPESARAGRDRDDSFRTERWDGRDVLVGLLPCRCGLRRQPPGEAGPSGAARLFLEVALYPDALSAPFARLRRNAAINAAAALALLLSVSLMALRLGPYVRGKQLEAQLDLARQVQHDLLPATSALPPSIDLAADCLPAAQVGGDFYDIVALPNGAAAFAVGDVSGHGVSAALLMGLIHGAMSTPPWGTAEAKPERAASQLNQLLLAKSSGERFASLFWCAYDPASSTLRYVNAGHLPALRLRPEAGRPWAVDRLAEGGPVLGLLGSATYRTVSVNAPAGDLLVLYSDGIVEAPNRQDEQFGEARLIAVVQAYAGESARAISDAVLAATRVFSEGRPAPDDRTLLVVRLWRASAERS